MTIFCKLILLGSVPIAALLLYAVYDFGLYLLRCRRRRANGRMRG